MRNELEASESAGRMQRVHHPMAPWMRWNALQVLQGSVRRQEVCIGSTDAPVQTWLRGGHYCGRSAEVRGVVLVPGVRKWRHIGASATRRCATETEQPMRRRWHASGARRLARRRAEVGVEAGREPGVWLWVVAEAVVPLVVALGQATGGA